MNPQKVVTPVKTGIKAVYTFLNFLDSGFRKGTKEKFLTKFIQTVAFIILADSGEKFSGKRIQGFIEDGSGGSPFTGEKEELSGLRNFGD